MTLYTTLLPVEGDDAEVEDGGRGGQHVQAPQQLELREAAKKSFFSGKSTKRGRGGKRLFTKENRTFFLIFFFIFNFFFNF